MDKIAICIKQICPIIITKIMKLVKDTDKNLIKKAVSDKEAEEAFRTILAWIIENIYLIDKATLTNLLYLELILFKKTVHNFNILK